MSKLVVALLFVALNYYVYAKAAWNPGVDVDETVSDYIKWYYGPAAEPMAEVWDLIERKIQLEALFSTGRLRVFGNVGDAMRLHPFYRGKIEVIPKCRIRDFNDFAIWHTCLGSDVPKTQNACPI